MLQILADKAQSTRAYLPWPEQKRSISVNADNLDAVSMFRRFFAHQTYVYVEDSRLLSVNSTNTNGIAMTLVNITHEWNLRGISKNRSEVFIRDS